MQWIAKIAKLEVDNEMAISFVLSNIPIISAVKDINDRTVMVNVERVRERQKTTPFLYAEARTN